MFIVYSYNYQFMLLSLKETVFKQGHYLGALRYTFVAMGNSSDY